MPIPAALKGSPPPPPAAEASAKDVEDPLARLVREAMQRAVDSARGRRPVDNRTNRIRLDTASGCFASVVRSS